MEVEVLWPGPGSSHHPEAALGIFDGPGHRHERGLWMAMVRAIVRRVGWVDVDPTGPRSNAIKLDRNSIEMQILSGGRRMERSIDSSARWSKSLPTSIYSNALLNDSTKR